MTPMETETDRLNRLICLLYTSRGYWISSEVQEMEEYLKESSRRARAQYRNDSPIRAYVMRRSGAGTIQVRAYTRRAKAGTRTDGQIRLEV